MEGGKKKKEDEKKEDKGRELDEPCATTGQQQPLRLFNHATQIIKRTEPTNCLDTIQFWLCSEISVD